MSIKERIAKEREARKAHVGLVMPIEGEEGKNIDNFTGRHEKTEEYRDCGPY